MQPKLNKCFFAIMISLLVLCLGAPTWADVSNTPKTPETASSDKVASVNGVAISRAQFDNALGYQQEIASMRGITISDSQLPLLKYQVLENLIDQELLYQESQKAGIKIDDTEVNETFEAQKKKAQFDTDAEFEEALKKSGKTLASYREEIKRGLAIDHFIKTKFTDNTTVSDSEAKNYYDSNPTYFEQPAQVRVSHIMIKVPSDADQAQKDEAKTKIEKVMKRLKAGEDFAAVAKDASEDENTKNDGGDLGYLTKGQVTKSFEDAAFALKKDQISDIVETGAGYHIIKLTDKKDAKTISFDEAKNDIVSSLKTNKVNNSVASYIKVLKTEYTIVTYPLN